ncbi:MAG: EscU/YscU/HrcU family type III secretion system export apparatus switch protein [Deltaproteobacteria bacterium]|nr:EscU/YscU/HrcU family type III secretion system export apparatus switch protein [Deltaproteobacteria bacterium]
MAGEKRFAPTARKLRKAREEGDVAKSRDISTVIVSLSGAFWLWFCKAEISTLIEFSQSSFSLSADFGAEDVLGLLDVAVGFLGKVLGSFLVVVFIASFLVEAAQVGFVFSLDVLVFRFSRLNAINGVKRILGVGQEGGEGCLTSGVIFESGKTVLYFLVLIVIGGAYLYSRGVGVVVFEFDDVADLALSWVGECFYLSFILLFSLLLLAGLDLAIKRKGRVKRLRMDAEEFKKELRDTEPPPEMRSMRQSLHEEILSQATVANLRKAKAIVVGAAD